MKTPTKVIRSLEGKEVRIISSPHEHHIGTIGIVEKVDYNDYELPYKLRIYDNAESKGFYYSWFGDDEIELI